MTAALTLRLMTRDEVDRLADWAVAEGWNLGLHDADIFWATDPEAFIAAELEGELIGGGAIVSYDGEFGFMGLFIVRPQFRGQGLGGQLWRARVTLLRGRLQEGASMGMDGVLEMADWYARGGFTFSHRTIRHEGSGEAVEPIAGIVRVTEVPFEQLAAYDRRCFPVARERFLRAWVSQDDALALASVDGGVLRGYGVARRCHRGAKIGPLFADDPAVAESLYASLAAFAPDEPVFIDVPEVNAWARSLVARRGMREVFGCARMYLGPAPRIEESRIYGNTTFELG